MPSVVDSSAISTTAHSSSLVTVALQLGPAGDQLDDDPGTARENLSTAQDDLARGWTSCASWRADSTLSCSPSRGSAGARCTAGTHARPGRGRGAAGRAPRPAGRGGRVLRGRRGDHERDEVRQASCATVQIHRSNGCATVTVRRRGRWRRPRPRLRSTWPRCPGRGPQRSPRRREPAPTGHPDNG